jgi:tetratricopeptide (TPR) repeat protein
MDSKIFVAILYAILLICTAAVFAPTLKFNFLAWDDVDLVVENPLLNPPTAESLQHIWSERYLGLYTPLSYTAWWVIAERQGMYPLPLSPGGFHELNWTLHIIAAILVFSILRKLLKTDIPAFLGAMLFALHPLQVEPVAWVAGMNNLLAAVFSLGAIRLYLEYCGSESEEPRWGFYAAGLAVFVLALFSKPTAVVVPFFVLILDLGFYKRPARDVLRWVIPWLMVAGYFAIKAREIQHTTVSAVAPLLRLPIAVHAIAFYLSKVIWPLNLSFDYGLSPQRVLDAGQWIWAAIGLAALLAILLIWRKSLKGVWIGLALIVAGLLPVLGLSPFYMQRYSTVADRYMYLGMLGAALALAWALSRMALSKIPAKAPSIVAGILIVVLTGRSVAQSFNWRDSMSLADHAIALDPGTAAGNYIKGTLLSQQGRWHESEPYFRRAADRLPTEGSIHNNVANALLKDGDLEGAIAEYKLAIDRHDLSLPRALLNLGAIYANQGRYDEAQETIGTVLRIQGIDEATKDVARRDLEALQRKRQ